MLLKNKKKDNVQSISRAAYTSFFSTEKIRKAFFTLLVICSGFMCLAQNEQEKHVPLLKGQVLNQEDGTPVPKAIITNQRTKATVSADLDGYFEIHALVTDSLVISSLGFLKQTIAIPAIYSIADQLVFYISPVSFLIPDINVRVKKEQMKIDKKNRIVSPYFRNDIMREKPAQLKAFDNQISFLKLPFGGKEKPRRQMVKAIDDEKLWSEASKFYTKELVMKLTGLNGTEADNFMMYLNSKKLYTEMKTKEYASYIILEQFKIYKKEGH